MYLIKIENRFPTWNKTLFAAHSSEANIFDEKKGATHREMKYKKNYIRNSFHINFKNHIKNIFALTHFNRFFFSSFFFFFRVLAGVADRNTVTPLTSTSVNQFEQSNNITTTMTTAVTVSQPTPNLTSSVNASPIHSTKNAIGTFIYTQVHTRIRLCRNWIYFSNVSTHMHNFFWLFTAKCTRWVSVGFCYFFSSDFAFILSFDFVLNDFCLAGNGAHASDRHWNLCKNIVDYSAHRKAKLQKAKMSHDSHMTRERQRER